MRSKEAAELARQPATVLVLGEIHYFARDNRSTMTTGAVRPGKRLALVAVKCVHTLIWLLVEAAVGYLLFAGVAERSDRRAAITGTVVAAESIVYLANGARCPLTGLAESLGAESGSVTDIYLPKWLARNLPVVHIPLVALVLFLHRRALFSRFSSRTS